MKSILIKNGTLIDPTQGFERQADLWISEGNIALIGRDLPTADHTIDARGCYVTPGLIDMHVHLREPGDEEEETIASGAAAAVAGGFTGIVCMPNTKPPLDNEGQITFVLREAQVVNLCNVYPTGAITKGREGNELAEMGSMLEQGAIAFTDDGAGVQNDAVMRKAFQYARMLDAMLMQHCEEQTLSDGAMNAGEVAIMLGLPGIPAEAEEMMIARDLLLNRSIGCRYHVQHLSTAGAVQLVRQAKAQGQRVTAEATPHHLLLSDDFCRSYDTNYKMSPPLRTAADMQAIIEGIKDGTIDALATDHAPHLAEEKEREFPYAPNGIIGMECAVSLYIKALIDPGHIDWRRLVELMSTSPAQILGLPRGTLQLGSVADVTIIDPNLEWTVDPAQFKSKSRNCPFGGWKLKGRPVATIVSGEIKWQLPR